MIQRSGCRSCWQAFLGVLLLVGISGCNESSSKSIPAKAAAPVEAKPLELAVSETSEEVPEAEPAPVAEIAAPSVATENNPATVEQVPMKKEPAKPAPNPADAPQSSSPGKAPKVALTVPELPEYVFEPQVLMSQQHLDSCLVKPGDTFPDAPLKDLAGDEHTIKELLGEKLTVIVFWSNANRLGREQVLRLESEIVKPFDNTGLNVIAININDPAEQITEVFPPDREVGFTSLLDTDGSLYSKVATQHQPRTYLLDADGKILWLDIEYSRSTARELSNAIHVQLGDVKIGDT
ncbi:MAG: redoxin domain-containing protein [Planctomycetales bacterium]|nr:redoxin domain-containing protein [Planctomycetales bacterium]